MNDQDIARGFGRLEALLEQHRRDQRREYDELRKAMGTLADRVAAHDQMFVADRERSRQSKEDLSNFKTAAEGESKALRQHFGKVESQLATLQLATTGQDGELARQTKILRWIKTWTPVITSVATAIAGAVASATAAYYAHAEAAAHVFGGH